MKFYTTEAEIEGARKFAKHMEHRINKGEEVPLVKTVHVDDWNAWHQFSFLCELINDREQISMRKISSRIRAAFRDAHTGKIEDMPDVRIIRELIICPDKVFEYGPFWPEQKRQFKKWSKWYVAVDAVIVEN